MFTVGHPGTETPKVIHRRPEPGPGDDLEEPTAAARGRGADVQSGRNRRDPNDPKRMSFRTMEKGSEKVLRMRIG